MNKASVQDGISCTMIALRSKMYATKIYCMILNDQMEKSPVMLVYIVPSVTSARAAKQNISWIVQAFWGGHIRSTLARASTMLV